MRETKMPIEIMKSEPLEVTFGTKSAFDKNVFDDALYPVAKPVTFLDLSWMEGFQIPMPSDYNQWHAREYMKRQQDAIEGLPLAAMKKAALRLGWWDLLMGRSKEEAGERLRQTFGAQRLKEMLGDAAWKDQLKGLLQKEASLGGQYYSPLADDCRKARKVLQEKRGGLDRLAYVVEGDLCKGCRFRQATPGGGEACGVFGLPLYREPGKGPKPALPKASSHPAGPLPPEDKVLHQKLDGRVKGDIFKAVIMAKGPTPEALVRALNQAAAEILRRLSLKENMGKAASEVGHSLSKTASAVTYDDALVYALTSVRGVRVAATHFNCQDPIHSGVPDALKALGARKAVDAVSAGQISRNAVLIAKPACEDCVFNLRSACGKWNLRFPPEKRVIPKAVDPTEQFGVASDAAVRSLDSALGAQLNQEARSAEVRKVTSLADAQKILSKTEFDFSELVE